VPVQDTDGDGVPDANDDYPNDDTKAFNNLNPTSTVAFEDLWPYKGDYDLNDVVVEYTYNVITNAANNVVRVEATYLLRATGGSFNNGFAVQFPVNRNQVSNVTGATLEAGQTKAVLVMFTNMRNEMGIWNTDPNQNPVDPITYTVAFNVTSAPSLASFGLGAYNPFIWNGTAGYGRGYEIHLPGQLPTDLATTALFGTGHDGTNISTGDTYVSNDGRFPWAISIPGSFNYPIEKADINTGYNKFATWVSSNGSLYADWYTNTAGYRNTEFLY
jgi:LruC domain-containing protein